MQAAFPDAVLIRPAAMFAPDDGFLTTILRLLRIMPAHPIFGDGRTKLQPAYADDVAAANDHGDFDPKLLRRNQVAGNAIDGGLIDAE